MEQVLALERAKDPERRNIPLVVRMKLDLAGAKIRLTDWRAFSDNDRQNLIDTPFEGPAGEEHFFRVLSQALESANREVMPRIAPAAPPITLWLNQAEPLEISEFRQDARVYTKWADLSRFERYLLCHAAQQQDPERLRTIALDTNLLTVQEV